MLGGAFWVAFLRNAMGAVLVLAVFLLLDRPRVAMKKAVFCNLVFGLIAVGGFSVWYMLDREAYLHFSGIATFPVLGIFCCLMSRGGVYLSLYKIAVGVYLLSVCVCLGIDLSRWGFGGSIWADIVIRFLFISLVLLFIGKRFRKIFFKNIDYLQSEMDLFSIVTLVVSVAIAALAAYWPDEREFSVLRIIRIFVILFMAGTIQYLIFHLHIHLGKEQRLEAEKQLMEMNEQLLRRQLEMREKAEQKAVKLRHNVLRRYLLIEESTKNGDRDKVLEYLKQYGEDLECCEEKTVCENRAVNGILAIYEEYARSRDIRMTMEVHMAGEPGFREMDLVALLATILENAIGLCVDSGEAERYIGMSVAFKSHKMVIQCQCTCGMNVSEEGLGNGEIKTWKGSRAGVSDIARAVSRYNGETDFRVGNHVFYVRVLLNLPQEREVTVQTGLRVYRADRAKA